jgi:HAD superfamily hydrolase (TIGR01509 family)
VIRAVFFDFFGVVEEEGKPNDALIEYIRDKLKSDYKIGIISNAAGDWANEILAEDEIELFDDITVSYKVGVTKPNPEIYNISLKQLGVEAADAVFIDDVEAYCDAARKLGMQTIYYENFAQMKRELEALLAVSDN